MMFYSSDRLLAYFPANDFSNVCNVRVDQNYFKSVFTAILILDYLKPEMTMDFCS